MVLIHRPSGYEPDTLPLRHTDIIILYIIFLNISYDEKIYTATLGSKIWIGDNLSKEKALKGEYKKSVIDNDWKLFFSGRDLILLNEIFKDYII